MPFTIKRHDRRPYLQFQLFEADGVTPLDTTAAIEINFVCRAKGSPDMKFKSPVSMLDALSGRGEYQWAATDTDTAGDFEYEFEIAWPNAEPQTIPADSYLSLVVVEDIG